MALSLCRGATIMKISLLTFSFTIYMYNNSVVAQGHGTEKNSDLTLISSAVAAVMISHDKEL